MRLLLLVAVSTLLAAPAFADPPAALGDAGQARIESQFHEFAKQWMSRVQTLQAKPVAMAGASQPIFTYRGYGDDYSPWWVDAPVGELVRVRAVGTSEEGVLGVAA